MQTEGKIAPQRMANIMAQVAEGMAVAHEAGIIHRDLKPENVFLVADADGEERVKILDFGVSKFDAALEDQPTRLTAEGTLVGTPYYMSPEQAAGKKVDARTDVYAMGIMLYEGLTGRLPFDAESVGELFVKIGSGECVPLRIRRPDLGAEWHDLVHRAFDREPERRFATAEAFRRELLVRAAGPTAARARTISDGGRDAVKDPRASADKSDASAARAPAEADVIAPVPDEVADDDGLPTTASEVIVVDAPAGQGRPASYSWMWAVGGALAASAALGVWQLAVADPVDDEPVVRAQPRERDEAPDEEGASLAEVGDEPAQPVADASVVEPTPIPTDAEERVTEERPVRPRNPAQAAGLDPNPYRGSPRR